MPRILIAEDQEDLRDMIAFTLRLEGFQAVLCGDGEEALTKAQESDPDLFVLDIHMPGLTGYELCKELKALPQFTETPIIIISAKGQDDEIQAGLDAGAKIYMRKPFAPQELVANINSLLEPA